jgi:hypothetical protein
VNCRTVRCIAASPCCWQTMGRNGADYPVRVSGLGFNQAAYSCLSIDRLSKHDILSGHLQASAERVKATDGPVLTLHDTTRSRTSGSALNSLATRARLPFEREGTAQVRDNCSRTAASGCTQVLLPRRQGAIAVRGQCWPDY